jgi:hypothetical protein
VTDRGVKIMETARSLRDYPERFGWLEALLAHHSLDTSEGILVELRSVPDQGCWVHYGVWLTTSRTFLRFVADEPYGKRILEGSGLLEHFEIEDITAKTSVAGHVPGTGRSFGWLALNALAQLPAVQPKV